MTPGAENMMAGSDKQTIVHVVDDNDYAEILNLSMNASRGDLLDLGNYECEYYDLLNMINNYYTPFIIVVGLVGNVLSCAVFLTTHLKMKSSSYYLAALSIADFGFLFMLSIVFLSNTEIFDLYNRPGWCQIIVFISSTCSVLSVWLIVAFTVERFIAVQYPLQRPLICTVSRAKVTVLTIVIAALGSQSYTIMTAGIVTQPSDGSYEDAPPNVQCELIEQHFALMQVINIIDTLVALIGPFILIVVMNTMIARNLFLFQHKFQHRSIEESLTSDKSDLNLPDSPYVGVNRNSIRMVSQQSHNSSYHTRTASRRSKSSEQFSGCVHSGRHFLSTRNQQSITKMLLLISSVFILLNLPSYVCRIYVFFFFSLWEEVPPASLWCLQQLFMLLYYTNFSINFLLYAMCGITFRRCLWKMLRKTLKNLTRFCSGNESNEDI